MILATCIRRPWVLIPGIVGHGRRSGKGRLVNYWLHMHGEKRGQGFGMDRLTSKLGAELRLSRRPPPQDLDGRVAEMPKQPRRDKRYLTLRLFEEDRELLQNLGRGRPE